MVDFIKGMRGKADCVGIVFDIYEDQAERFLEISTHLRETDSSIDFEVVKCLALPDLESEDNAKWRGGGQSNDYKGGAAGGRHNRHQSYNLNSGGFSGLGNNPAKTNDNDFGSNASQKASGTGRGGGGFHSR